MVVVLRLAAKSCTGNLSAKPARKEDHELTFTIYQRELLY